jgi:hypothetical protein
MTKTVKSLTLKGLGKVISQHLPNGTVSNLKLNRFYLVCDKEKLTIHVMCLTAAGFFTIFL